MARSFSYDHYRDNKRDDRSALRKADRKAFTQTRPEPDGQGPALHGEGAQARTRELWRELHEGERQQRAAAEARSAQVPIGALPPSEEAPEALEEEGRTKGATKKGAETERAPEERLESPMATLQAEAKTQWSTLHQSLGDAVGAFARLLRLPVTALKMREPRTG